MRGRRLIAAIAGLGAVGFVACCALVLFFLLAPFGPIHEERIAIAIEETQTAQARIAASPTEPPTLHPTVTPPPPTRTPQPSPTPTARPMPTPTLGPIAVIDDFSSNLGIWDCGVCEWRDGVLVLGPWPASGAYVQHSAVCVACGEPRHFRMGVDVTFGEGQTDRGYGLLVKWNDKVLITAEVTAWQTADVWKYDYARNEWEWLNGVWSGHVRPGRVTNRIEVEVSGDEATPGKATITFTVNGRNLVVLYNQPSDPGVVGLTLFGHAVEVLFDNFEFLELPPYSGLGPSMPSGPSG